MSGELVPPRPTGPIPVAASACLTGLEVRYDGSGARSSYPHSQLENWLELKPICPEVGVGMDTPRTPIRLVGSSTSPRVVDVADSSIEYTDQLADYGREMAAKYADKVSGYVFMKNSPSCGLFRVKVYPDGSGMPVRAGRGVYAAAFADAWPALPLEECGRLQDEILRENFVARVFAYAHWQKFARRGVSAASLIAFHTQYKYLLMAHSIPAYKAAGRLLAQLKEDVPQKSTEYIQILMSGLSRPASRGGHANVLSHMQGYFKKVLSDDERQECSVLIEDYRRGNQPLLAVLAVLRHHLKRYPDAYLEVQVYFDPAPSRLRVKL